MIFVSWNVIHSRVGCPERGWRRSHDVNAVCPGPTETQMMKDIARGGMFPALIRPDEIAEVVLFLASQNSSAITGTAIDAFGPNHPLFR